MKIKAWTNKNISSEKRTKLISAITLLIVAVITMTALSYAWFQNHIDISGVGVNVGKMLYDFEGYHSDLYTGGNALVQDFRFSTTEGDNGNIKEEHIDLESVHAASGISSFTTVDANNVGQVFVVIKKHEKSIDFDAVLTFNFNRLVVNVNGVDKSAIDYTDSVWFNVYDESLSFSSYMNNGSGTLEDYAEAHPLSDTQKVYVEESSELLSAMNGRSINKKMTSENNYVLIRIVYGWSGDAVGQIHSGVDVPMRVDLNVMQNGIVDGEDSANRQTISVRTQAELRKALDTHLPYDQIQITESFTYTGDITISRPVDIVLLKDLTIQGNLTYLYMQPTTFTINAAGGRLIIKNLREGLGGGNFVVDVPKGSFKIIGLNNPDPGCADIYVENEFRICTETEHPDYTDAKEDENVHNIDKVTGLLLNGCRICEYDGMNSAEESLKTIKLGGNARVFVSSRTEAGPIKATMKCRWAKIFNQGTIESLDLSEMARDITLKEDCPAIKVDSRGNWVDETILLPSWSMRFFKPGDPNESYTTYRGNTKIIFNYGSGNMKAYVLGSTVGVNGYGMVDSNEIDAKLFFDDYELSEYDPSLRSDIERKYRDIFVEKPYLDGEGNPDPTKIVVYYEEPDHEIFAWDGYDFKPGVFGTTLESIISHYCTTIREDERIADITSLVYVEIICHTSRELKEEDYAYLRQMSALVEINLAESVSTDKSLPEGALAGLTNLTKVTMSNYDTVWNKNILQDTDVDELWLPASLVKLNSTIFEDNSDPKNPVRYNLYDVIGGIRIIHTSTTIVEGFDESSLGTNAENRSDTIFYDDDDEDIYRVKQYFFVPNEVTLEGYRAKYTSLTGGANAAWNRCIFVEGEKGETQIFGDYVIRNIDNDNKTCEFVTYIKDAAFDAEAALNSEYAFDFKSITLTVINEDGEEEVVKCSITSYEDYAFCNRINAETAVSFGNNLTKIGAYAFATAMRPSESKADSETGYTNKNNISSVTFSTSGEFATLGDYAFFNVTALKTVSAKVVTTAGAGCFWNCTSLKTADLERLTTVTGKRLFKGCSKLEKVDIGIIEKNDANQSATNFEFISGNNNVIIEIHSQGQSVSFTKGLAENIGRIFVQDAYIDLYSDYITRVVELGTHTMETVLRADSAGKVLPNDAPVEDVCYYFFPVLDASGEETDETVLSVYMGDTIYGDGRDVTLMGKFVDEAKGKTYVVTRIGRAAYRLTKMGNINTLKVPDGVTSIGHGAFAGDSAAKYCVTFDLNNTVKAEAEAFYKMSAVKLYGNKLVEVGPKAISEMTSLVVACLPKLDRLTGVYTGGSYPSVNTVFYGCSKLHVAYVGPSTSIRYCKNGNYDYGVPPDKLTMFFVDGSGNASNILDKNTFMYVHGIIANSTASLYGSMTTSAGNDFSNVVLASWYTISGVSGAANAGGSISYTITLPGYVFIKSSETTLTQVATADELKLIPGIENFTTKYTTPEVLYDTGNTVMLYDADHTDNVSGGTMPNYLASEYSREGYVYKVGDLGKGSYNYVNIGTKYFKIGCFVKTYSITMTSAVVSTITTLDMSNVDTISGKLYDFSNVTKFIVNNLQILSKDQIINFKNVKELYLPSFVKTTAVYPIYGATGIQSVIFGENTKEFSTAPFWTSTGIKKITFLGKSVVPLPNKHSNGHYWISSAVDKTLVFVVHASLLKDTNGDGVYDVYTDGVKEYKNSYGLTPISNFITFEEMYKDPDTQIVYYWEKLVDGSARITSVVGDFTTDLVIPSVVTIKDSDGNVVSSHDVVSIDKSIFALATDLKTLTLPATLQYVDFKPSELPATIESITIDSSNSRFMTIDGVLYRKNAEGNPEAILVFPQNNKMGVTFNLPQTVTQIADEAFYGVQYLRRVNVNSVVTVGNRAFANSLDLTNITFTMQNPSTFLGYDTFLGADVELFIYVPAGCIDSYKANVWFDNFVRVEGVVNGEKVFEDMFAEIHEHTLNSFGYCTDPECPDPDEMIVECEFDGNTFTLDVAQGATGLYYKITATKAMTLTFTQFAWGVDMPFMQAWITLSENPAAGTTLSTTGTVTLTTAGQTLYFTVMGVPHILTITQS